MARKQRKHDLQNMPANNRDGDGQAELEGPVTLGRRVPKQTGIAADIRDIGNNLFSEILVPAAKSTIVDFVNNGVSELIFGSSTKRPTSRRGGRGGRDNFSYTNYSTRSRGRKQNHGYRRADDREGYSRLNNRRRRSNPMEEDIFFKHRSDAEYILGQMINEIAEFGITTVGSLYNLCGIGSNAANEQWGWDSLGGTRIEYAPSNGYVIGLPDPIYLD